ncbi:MAG: 2-methylisocitrate lyase-like PEP mutase family enzyme [Gammaproteobacteria bacterium]|jgi:2-methylisocitrate lyase-like PEP mutase family enzyme
MNRCAQLRMLIDRTEILIAPGAYDPFVARIVQAAGFEALYMTGAGVSHVRLGQPDLGLLTFSEMVDQAGRIADAVDLPLIADADTGYGNALNVMRTVRAYERAGVAGMHIEDQSMPKRCGHFDQKQVIDTNEMVGKLKAALDARVDPNFIIIARTDARTVLGLDETMARAHAYAEAGADVIFVESPLSEDELALIGSSISTPLLANMVESGKTPILPAQRLQELGFSLVIHPGAVGRFVSHQLKGFLERVKAEGSTLSQLDQMSDFKTQNEVVGLSQMLALAERYKS